MVSEKEHLEMNEISRFWSKSCIDGTHLDVTVWSLAMTLGYLTTGEGIVFSLEMVKQLRILNTRWDVYTDCNHLYGG